ncbi:MAG: putative sulfate exporter family transporter [Acidobacteriota bacterium]|nr:MAG: putative sulfate exporter family transporter [Acidobacteriota bacterium]
MVENSDSKDDVSRSNLLKLEDWWAVWIGGGLLLICVLVPGLTIPKVGKWLTSPFEVVSPELVVGILILGLFLALFLSVGTWIMDSVVWTFLRGFWLVFLIAVVSYIVAEQRAIAAKGLGYALWALLIGLLVSNTVGVPEWLRGGLRSELFIKIGLVLLGAEILFGNILVLGLPGLFVAWLVTPVVIITMFWFGTRVLRMSSKALVIVVAAATSVCGVSAAIAAAAASRAKKEELTLAVGMTLIFTVLMMVGMPLLVKTSGMDAVVGAAWIGGTVDATGAVVAAGSMLGERAEQVAAVVKMIQNILIGVVAFFIALFWVARVEREPSGRRPDAMEVWRRFPKFIVGFLAASLIFSFLLEPTMGSDAVRGILAQSKALRGWFFCLAFVSIGLESNFVELKKQMAGGKPIQLYIVGQSFNLVLTLLAAYLAFGGILFALDF